MHKSIQRVYREYTESMQEYTNLCQSLSPLLPIRTLSQARRDVPEGHMGVLRLKKMISMLAK